MSHYDKWDAEAESDPKPLRHRDCQAGYCQACDELEYTETVYPVAQPKRAVKPAWYCKRCDMLLVSRGGYGCEAGKCFSCGDDLVPEGRRCSDCGAYNRYPVPVNQPCRLCGGRIEAEVA